MNIFGIIFLAVVLYIIISRINNKAKKTERIANRQKHFAKVKEEVKKIDLELSVEKKVKCDDAIIRVYKGSMYGVIKELINTQDKCKISSKEVSPGWSPRTLKDFFFDPNIKFEKWFSEKGTTLKPKQILKMNLSIIEQQEDYNKKYKTQMHVSRSLRLDGKVGANLICINGYYFLSEMYRDALNLFSGEINSQVFINGKTQTNDNKINTDVLEVEDKTVEDLQINEIEKNNNKVKFCSKCGNNVENQKFCAKCGNKT
jgi:hypothetical protein